MSNRGAILLGSILIAAIILDAIIYGSDNLLFLAKKFADMLEWMAFWR